MADFLNLHLNLNTRTRDLMAETWDLKNVSCLGRDGSPNRPFADGDADLNRDNGGLGEPALPKGTLSQSSGLRFPFERASSRHLK
jgi:hypothetical protein